MVKPIVEPELFGVLKSTSSVNIFVPAVVAITLRSNALYSIFCKLSVLTIGNTTPPLLAKIVLIFGYTLYNSRLELALFSILL